MTILQVKGFGASRAATVYRAPNPPSRKRVVVANAADDNSAEQASSILEAFFYGRAFAVTLSRRVTDEVLNVVSEISKAVAERPQRIREFQVLLMLPHSTLASSACCLAMVASTILRIRGRAAGSWVARRTVRQRNGNSLTVEVHGPISLFGVTRTPCSP